MNNDRLLAVDFGRGVSVIIMVFVHTLWMYGDTDTQSNSWLGEVIHLLGKGTASFLILMGVSLMLSRNQTPLLLLKRGLMVLTVGYLMNLLKFVVPIEVFGTMPANFIAAYGWEAPLNFTQLKYLVLTGDILQMAGFALLFIGLIRSVTSNKYAYLAIALVIALVSQELRGFRPSIEGLQGLDYFADVLWGAHFNIYFPIFPWLSCILVGMFLGTLYVEQQRNSALLYRYSRNMGLVLVAVGGGLCAYNFDYHFADFFHTGPGGIMYLTGLNLVGLWLVNIIVERFSLPKLYGVLSYCSARVTSMYVIQWVAICWGMGIIGFQTLSTIELLAMMPVTLAVTLLVQKGFDMLSHWWSKPAKYGVTIVTKASE